MDSKEFHEDKIREILEALKQGEANLFLACVSLFYLGVHLVDYYLLANGYGSISNHGDRSNKLRRINGKLFVVWKSLLSISMDQRYCALTTDRHLSSMVNDIKNILDYVEL